MFAQEVRHLFGPGMSPLRPLHLALSFYLQRSDYKDPPSKPVLCAKLNMLHPTIRDAVFSQDSLRRLLVNQLLQLSVTVAFLPLSPLPRT